MSSPAAGRPVSRPTAGPVLRAGLIGLGNMGRNHARVLAGLDGVEFVGAADPARAGTRLAGGVPVVDTVGELIGAGLDYAIVACPTALHHPVGLELAAAGVHALFEKPLADTVEAAQALVDAYAAAGLVGGVGHIERYNPALQQLRRRLNDGELGEIYQVVTRRQGPFPARIADVGVVKDLATHDIDLTAWVTGQEYVSVSARTTRKSGRDHEDMVLAVGELSGGVMVSHIVNWLSPLKERSTVVTGEHGCFTADTLTADLTYYRNGAVATEWETIRNFRGVAEGDVTRFAIPRREPLVVEHELFRDAVTRQDEDGIVSLAQGLRTVQVSAAVLDAAASGQTVTLS